LIPELVILKYNLLWCLYCCDYHGQKAKGTKEIRCQEQQKRKEG